MTFYTPESLDFLQQLALNNSRDWFNYHKSDYETYIKIPTAKFADAMVNALNGLTGHNYKYKIFRIYRDIRFSKDKTPYNTHQRISFIPDIGENPPAWYFSLEKNHFVLGTGKFGFEKDDLKRWRNRIAGPDGARLLELMVRLETNGLRFGEPELKRVPSDFPPEHPHENLLRRKGLAVWMDFDDTSLVIGENAVKHCLAAYQTMRPIFNVLSSQDGQRIDQRL